MLTSRSYDIDERIIAPRLYADDPGRDWTPEGIAVSAGCTLELSRFLGEYKSFLGLDDTMFLRMDLYFDRERVYVLDANAAFVDGWGNALNMARAAGMRIGDRVASLLSDRFPRKLFLAPGSEPYRPEFMLCRDELNNLVDPGPGPVREVSETDVLRKPDRRRGETRDRIYSYGAYARSETNDVFPRDPLRADDKRQLARFGREWTGKSVIVPPILDNRTPWERAPKDGVYKIANKSDLEPLGQAGLRRVSIGKPSRPVARAAWDEGKLVAQARVAPAVDAAGRYRQLVVLALDDTPVAGYVQNSRNTVISDASVQWPLRFAEK